MLQMQFPVYPFLDSERRKIIFPQLPKLQIIFSHAIQELKAGKVLALGIRPLGPRILPILPTEAIMKNGEMPVCFLTNNDITGGNSGSDVLNAKGELIGLAFDGNYESMSGDVIFERDLQRCICVDIRYVLFVMDKFGGAGYLLNEMKFN